MLVRSLKTNLKTSKEMMIVKDDYAVPACNSPSPDSVYKCSHPLLVKGVVSAFGQMSTLPSPLHI